MLKVWQLKHPGQVILSFRDFLDPEEMGIPTERVHFGLS